MRFYFAYNQFSLLKSYDDDVEKADQLDLEKIVPLGMGYFPVGEPVLRHSVVLISSDNLLGRLRLVDLPADILCRKIDPVFR